MDKRRQGLILISCCAGLSRRWEVSMDISQTALSCGCLDFTVSLLLIIDLQHLHPADR